MSRLLKPEFVRTDLPVILALKETRSWKTDELRVPGFVVFGKEFGINSLLISDCLSKVQKSWQSERCTAVLVEFSMVMSVYASDSGNDLEHEKCVEKVTNISRDGRRNRSKHFSIAGDFNIELGLLGIGEENDEELDHLYGPLCWPECGLKKLMWYSVMKEFDCMGRTKRVGSHTSAMGPQRAYVTAGLRAGPQKQCPAQRLSSTSTSYAVRGTTIQCTLLLKKRKFEGDDDTPYVATMEVKTAFDVANPEHIANIMDSQKTHGKPECSRLDHGCLGEMTNLEGKATFESVECCFPFTECIRQGSVEAPRLWLKMALKILWNGGRRLEEEEDGAPH